MKILGIDPGTTAGWCTGADTNGIWKCAAKPYESVSMRLIKFRSSMKEVVEAEEIELIVYEKPGGRNYTGVKAHANFEGIIQEFALDHKLEYKGYSAGEIKRFATGKGNCGKPAMIQACKDRLNITPLDDNHADAIFLYLLAEYEWNGLMIET